jgi:hypothetical protein
MAYQFTVGPITGINMIRKVPIWMFGLSMVFAVTGFALRGKSNLDHIDRVYGLHAQELYSKARILDLLNLGQIEEAKELLKKDVEGIGLTVAVCIMNKCSEEAVKVRGEYTDL